MKQLRFEIKYATVNYTRLDFIRKFNNPGEERKSIAVTVSVSDWEDGYPETVKLIKNFSEVSEALSFMDGLDLQDNKHYELEGSIKLLKDEDGTEHIQEYVLEDYTEKTDE